MPRTGGYRRSAVWRPCGVTPHAALQNKSVVCSGSRVTNSTVKKLRWSVKQGGINVETYTKSTCSHVYKSNTWTKTGWLYFRLNIDCKDERETDNIKNDFPLE